jgi:ABC-type taurine transport system substrate-binding protein
MSHLRKKIMKTRKTTMKRIAMVIAVAIATIWTIGGASTAEAVIAIIRQTGMFSLAQGQATSAHVVNTGEERGIVVDWRVLDSAGNIIAQLDRRRVELGQASSFDFGPLGLAEGQRMAIRVELMVEGASRNHPGFIATQEVHNVGDGKTTVFLPYME